MKFPIKFKFAFSIASASFLTIPHVENTKLILTFDKDAVSMYRMANTLGFSKKVESLSNDYYASPKDKIVTYTLSGDTIQYYISPGERMLLYCKLDKLYKYSKYLKFISLKKKYLLKGKYLGYKTILFEDKSGFEELELSFYNEEISKIKYTSHPD